MLLLIVVVLIIIFYIFRPKYRHPEIIKNALTPEECEYIIKKAEPLLETSGISGSVHINTDIRNSDTAWLSHDDPVVKNIVLKFGKDCDVCENLQVVRYKPGGFYKLHQDAIHNLENKRIHTFIFALNDEYEGGYTQFPLIDKEYKLKSGDALSFDTLDSWGKINRKSLHCGDTVKNGEKWICNLWVHQSRID